MALKLDYKNSNHLPQISLNRKKIVILPLEHCNMNVGIGVSLTKINLYGKSD